MKKNLLIYGLVAIVAIALVAVPFFSFTANEEPTSIPNSDAKGMDILSEGGEGAFDILKNIIAPEAQKHQETFSKKCVDIINRCNSTEDAHRNNPVFEQWAKEAEAEKAASSSNEVVDNGDN